MIAKTQGNQCTLYLDLIVCENFKLVKKIGTGSFGQIYLASNKDNLNEKYAAKLEESGIKNPHLHYQAKIYRYLASEGGFKGLPKLIRQSSQRYYHIMLMQLLGTSVEDIFMRNNRKISLKSALVIGYQMIERIRSLHQRQIIHRDLKPDNFLLGIGNNSDVIYIIDFGLSRRYAKDGKHIPFKQGKQMMGTARYASINNHMGSQLSRRDDIQLIAYVLMYLIRGSLPWQSLTAKDTQTKQRLIMQKKIATSAQQLCKGLPKQLITFINYARNLKFEQHPNYEYLLHLISQCLQMKNIKTQSSIFDNVEQKQKQQNQQQQNKRNPDQKINCNLPQIGVEKQRNSISLNKFGIFAIRNSLLSTNINQKQPLRLNSSNKTLTKSNDFSSINNSKINTQSQTYHSNNHNHSNTPNSYNNSNSNNKQNNQNGKQKQPNSLLHRRKSKSVDKYQLSNPIINPCINIKNNLNIRKHSFNLNKQKILAVRLSIVKKL